MLIEKQSRNRLGQAKAELNVLELQSHGGLFVEAVEATRMPMVVTDPKILGNPIIYANAAFLEMCGYEKDEVLGQRYFFLIGQNADPVMKERIDAALAAQHGMTEDVIFQTKNGRRIWVSAVVSPVVENGEVVRHFACFINITDRVRSENDLRIANETLDRRVALRTKRLQQSKDKLEEEVERRRRTETLLREALDEGEKGLRYRDFLVREVNHRTKNALQLATTLLQLQAKRSEPLVRDALNTAMCRLARIGDVHALLTYQGETPNRIDVAPYLSRLCKDIIESSVGTPGQVEIEIHTDEEVMWGADLVIPLGLIVGEALTNSVKYAFPNGCRGKVRVDLILIADGLVSLRIEDDGIGLSSSRRAQSLGMKLIEVFAMQIRGSATIENRAQGHGTVVCVIFENPDIRASNSISYLDKKPG